MLDPLLMNDANGADATELAPRGADVRAPRRSGAATARTSKAIAHAARRTAPWLTGAALLCGLPGSASATDFEVNAETAGQAYEVSSPWGDTVLARRRFMQTLSLGAYNLQGQYKPGEADYSIVMRLRLDADFGINDNVDGTAETSFANGAGSRFVPGLQVAPLDLMYGYVEGRNLAKGWLGFRVGRQYMTDMLGWWSFDGGLFRITTPYFVQAEFYGGLEQRGGLPLSSSRFERGGIWRGSHSGFSAGSSDEPSAADYPSYQYAQIAPAFGVALESAGPSWIHGRLSYRRVYNTGSSITQQFPDPGGGYRRVKGLRLSQERIGYAADVNKNDLGGIKGGFSYDLYNQLVGSFYGGLEAYLGKRAIVGADIDYFEPTFDADSIWNWFTKSPVTTITGRASIDITKAIDVAVSGGARLWAADGDPDTFGAGQCTAERLAADCVGKVAIDPSFPSGAKTYSRDEANRSTSIAPDVIANLSGRYRRSTEDVSLRGMLETGSRGRRVGGDLAGEKRFDGRRYTLGARLSVYDWDDPIRPDRSATSFSYVLGAGYKPGSVADFRVEWEHDMNRLVGQRFRVVGLVNLWVIK